MLVVSNDYWSVKGIQAYVSVGEANSLFDSSDRREVCIITNHSWAAFIVRDWKLSVWRLFPVVARRTTSLSVSLSLPLSRSASPHADFAARYLPHVHAIASSHDDSRRDLNVRLLFFSFLVHSPRSPFTLYYPTSSLTCIVFSRDSFNVNWRSRRLNSALLIFFSLSRNNLLLWNGSTFHSNDCIILYIILTIYTVLNCP